MTESAKGRLDIAIWEDKGIFGWSILLDGKTEVLFRGQSGGFGFASKEAAMSSAVDAGWVQTSGGSYFLDNKINVSQTLGAKEG